MLPITAATTLVASILVATGTPATGQAVTDQPATAMSAVRAGDVESWQVDLSAVGADDSNVTSVDGRLRLAGGTTRAASADAPMTDGMLVTAPHQLRTPTDTIAATVDADLPPTTLVLVDVRGLRADGTWSEWAQVAQATADRGTADHDTAAQDATSPDTPTRLSEPARTVQVRLTLQTAGKDTPEVRSVRLTAEPATGPPAARGVPLEFRVFATREGLVGGTTANGHVIVERDHFVALPSRRGLSTRGDGAYSVRVCADNGRCAWAPVWDVGPWNTRDDYWNPAGVRQMWVDLPHGRPQAQAARLEGYNGGRDQYDRVVRNPAGIDLADGTFWDALKLTDNAWVTVTYLWTGAEPTATVVTNGVPLNVRDHPGTATPPVGLAGNHAQLHVECEATGEPATGTQGLSDRWLRVAPGRYVSKAYLTVQHPVPACG